MLHECIGGEKVGGRSDNVIRKAHEVCLAIL